MSIVLPTTIQPPAATCPRILVIYGPPKIGKTSILAALPGCLLVDIEDGSDFVSALKLKLKSLDEFHEFEKEMKKSGSKELYKFGALDTLDQLEEWCEVEATKRYKDSVIGKNFSEDSILSLPKGGGYFHLRNVFYEYFRRFYFLFDRVILIGHIRDSMIVSEGKETAAKDLDLSGKIRNIVCKAADAVGHAFRDKDGKLKVSFITNDTANCGSRCAYLKGKIFEFSDPATVEDWKRIYTFL